MEFMEYEVSFYIALVFIGCFFYDVARTWAQLLIELFIWIFRFTKKKLLQKFGIQKQTDESEVD